MSLQISTEIFTFLRFLPAILIRRQSPPEFFASSFPFFSFFFIFLQLSLKAVIQSLQLVLEPSYTGSQTCYSPLLLTHTYNYSPIRHVLVMDFLLPELEQDLELGSYDLLPANSPPPLDPGADDEMDEVDDVEEDNLFEGFTPSEVDTTLSLAFWDNQGKQSLEAASANTSNKDNIAIVQDPPPSLESKRLFGDAANTDFDPLVSDSLLPWDAFVQSHIQSNYPSNFFDMAGFNLKEEPQLDVIKEEDTQLDFIIKEKPIVAPVPPSVVPQLSELPELSSVSTNSELPSPPMPTTLRRNHKYSIPSSTSSSFSLSSSTDQGEQQEPVRTEEERKRRNRVYAKRSRDLKNMKYKEAMDLNEDLKRQLRQLQEENHELKLDNQRLSFQVKEYQHRCDVKCE